MVKRNRKTSSQEPETTPIRWGWIYVWLLFVFAGILLATTQSVERKALEMKMDGLIEKKLSLQNTLSEVRVQYNQKQSFQEVSRLVEALHLELAPSSVPAIRLAAAGAIGEATP